MSHAAIQGTRGQAQQFTNAWIQTTCTLGSSMCWDYTVATNSMGYYAIPTPNPIYFGFAGVLWNASEKTGTPETNQLLISGGFCPKLRASTVGGLIGPSAAITALSPLIAGATPTSGVDQEGRMSVYVHRVDTQPSYWTGFPIKAVSLDAVTQASLTGTVRAFICNM